MLDDRVRAVLERLEREDASERERGLPPEQRARQVEPTTGRFLFSLVAPQTDCEVLELGGSRGYSTIWLAAGVRYLGGRVLSLEHDPAKIEAWRRTSRRRALEEWAELRRGRRVRAAASDRRRVRRRLPRRREGRLRRAVPARARQGRAGRARSSRTTSSRTPTRSPQYSAARQADPTLLSVTVPLDRGLELSVVLR